MISTFDVLPDPGINVVDRPHPFSGGDLLAAKPVHRRLAQNLPGQFDTGAPIGNIFLSSEVVKQDLWGLTGIVRANKYRSPTRWFIRADMNLKPMSIECCPPVVAHGAGQEVVLNIW